MWAFLAGWGSIFDLWPVVSCEEVYAQKADDILCRSMKNIRRSMKNIDAADDDLAQGDVERALLTAERAVDQEIERGRAALMVAIASIKWGQWFGAGFVFVALAGSMTALYAGHGSLATILWGSALISVVVAFALGRLPGWIEAFGRKSE